MSTVIVTIGGTATPGDLLMLSYSSPTRGGQSTLKYRVRPSIDSIVTDPVTGDKSVQTITDTLSTIVQGFVDEFSRGQEWPLPEFDVTRRNDTSFVVKQKNADNFFSGIVFASHVQSANGGDPTETMTLEVL